MKKVAVKFLTAAAVTLAVFDGALIADKNLKPAITAFFHDAVSYGSAVIFNSGSAPDNPTDYVNDDVYYIYYEMLDDNQKAAYALIYENAENLKSAFEMPIDISPKALTDVLSAVYCDHPELFWLDTEYTLTYAQEDENVLNVQLFFNETADDLDQARTLFENAAEEIIQAAMQYDLAWEKEKYVHDTLIAMIDYDQDAKMSQSAYSGLVNKATVCAGYARSFQYIMTCLNIPVYYVTGTVPEEHSWNIIELNNEYYNVDLTWDDQAETIYTFFNVTDDDFSFTHTRTGLSVNLPACNGEKYGLGEPVYDIYEGIVN